MNHRKITGDTHAYPSFEIKDSALEPHLQTRQAPNTERGAYLKWLRYYQDFCNKYHFPESQRESLPHFMAKLEQKGQTKAQRKQAAHSIRLYYELLHAGGLKAIDASPP